MESHISVVQFYYYINITENREKPYVDDGARNFILGIDTRGPFFYNQW